MRVDGRTYILYPPPFVLGFFECIHGCVLCKQTAEEPGARVSDVVVVVVVCEGTHGGEGGGSGRDEGQLKESGKRRVRRLRGEDNEQCVC